MATLPSYRYDELSHEGLLVLYGVVCEEIHRLREFEWKVAAASVVLTGGLIAVLANERFAPLLAGFVGGVRVRCLVSTAQLIAALFGIWCLHVAHGYLADQRTIRSRIEVALGFHEVGRYLPDTAMLPTAFGTPKRYFFQVRGLVLPLIVLMITLQLIAGYIVWVLK